MVCYVTYHLSVNLMDYARFAARWHLLVGVYDCRGHCQCCCHHLGNTSVTYIPLNQSDLVNKIIMDLNYFTKKSAVNTEVVDTTHSSEGSRYKYNLFKAFWQAYHEAHPGKTKTTAQTEAGKVWKQVKHDEKLVQQYISEYKQKAKITRHKLDAFFIKASQKTKLNPKPLEPENLSMDDQESPQLDNNHIEPPDDLPADIADLSVKKLHQPRIKSDYLYQCWKQILLLIK